jgi:PAS domain S-box-containing protein
MTNATVAAPTRTRTILIVEDSRIYREQLRHYLDLDDRYSYQILETETGAEGLRQYRLAQPDAILLDYVLPDMNGLEFLQILQKQIKRPDLPVVLMTAFEREKLATQAIEHGAQQYLNKAELTNENLRLSLHNAIKQGELLRQVAELKQQNERHLKILHRQEEQLRMALTAAQMGIWDWDLVTGTIEWNQEHEELFGLSHGSFDGSYDAFDRCIHPDDREQVHHVVIQSIEEGAILCHQFRIVWSDGSIHWIEMLGEAYFNEDGKPIRAIGTVANIDERQQAQAMLQNQLEQQRLVMDLTQRIRQSLDLYEILQTTVDEVRRFLQTDRVIIYKFEPDWSGTVIVESVGEGWQSLLGQQIGDTCICGSVNHFKQGIATVKFDVYAANLDPAHLQLLVGFQVRANLVVPIVLGEQLWGLTIAHHCSDVHAWQDTEIDLVQQLASQVSIAIQQADLLIESQMELTQRKQTEMSLQLLNAELAQRQRVEKLKDEFIGIVSHELRTPLTSMRGSLGLLAMGLMDDEPEQMKQMIQIAAIETERLVRMVNDILDLDKLETDPHSMELEWCNAADLLSRSIEVMSGSAQDANVTLTLDCPAVEIWAAPDRLIQTFTNLLSNAIKFSHAGGSVSLTAQIVDAPLTQPESRLRSNTDAQPPTPMTAAQHIRFAIADRGRGIPPDKLASIFNRFQQVDASDSRDKGGTGLGLAICKSIVEQHQGQIWVESEWGKGSTFFIALPHNANR